MLNEVVFLPNVISTFIMVGVIWYAHIAFYPLLSFIGKKEFRLYKEEYNKRVMPAATVILLIEFLSSVLLIWFRPLAIKLSYALVGLLFLFIIWFLTWIIEVPQHKILQNGFNEKSYRILIKINFFRCILWTSRAFIALLMIILIL